MVGGFRYYFGPAWDKVYQFDDGSTFPVTTRFSVDSEPSMTVAPSAPLPGDPQGIGGSYYDTAGLGKGFLDFGDREVSSVKFWQNLGADESVIGANELRFIPGPAANVAVGQEFLLGTFHFTNGGWFGSIPQADGTPYIYPDSEFFFRLSTVSVIPELNGHIFQGYLDLHVTGAPLDAPPGDDADYIYFLNRTDLGYVGAYESYNLPPGGSNTGSIALYGKIGSLTPTRFADGDGLVLAESLPDAAVPAPGALGLLAVGLAGMGAIRRRARAA